MEVKNYKKTLNWAVPALFTFVFALATWPTLTVLGSRWLKFDESFSHGFLLLAVCFVLSVTTWRRCRPLVGCYWVWLPVFLGSLVFYLGGRVLMIETFQYLALLPIFGGGLLILWGWRQTVPFIIPVGLMAFTLPLWDYLSWPLQMITVTVNEWMLTPLNIDFVVDGIFVTFPGVGAFEIAHGCSGLRYFLVGVTMATLYGELNLRQWRNRILLLGVGVLLALIANWIRVFIIIYQGYETNMTSPLIDDHDMFGWWVFAASLVPLFFFARFLEKKEVDKATKAEAKVSASRPDRLPGTTKPATAALTTILPVAFFGVVAALVSPSQHLEAQESTRSHDFAPVDSGYWMPLFQKQLTEWQPKIVMPDQLLERTYIDRADVESGISPEEAVFVGLYSYGYQRPGREVVQYENRLFDSKNLTPTGTFSVPAGENMQLAGLSLKYRQSDNTVHLAYGYYVEGRWENNELQAKLAALPGIFNRRTDASLLVIGVQCDSCEGDEILAEITPEIRQRVQQHLDNVYDGKGPGHLGD